MVREHGVTVAYKEAPIPKHYAVVYLGRQKKEARQSRYLRRLTGSQLVPTVGTRCIGLFAAERFDGIDKGSFDALDANCQ